MVISKRKVVTRMGAALTAAALVVPLLSAVAASPASATRAPSITSFPRNETLYTSGTAYSPPSNWNPLDSGSRYTGTMGLLYETLFLYDPIHNKYLPWLATSGSWTGPSTYTMQVRNNVKWSNGSSAHRRRCRLLDQPGQGQPGRPLQQPGPVPRARRGSQRQHRHGALHQPCSVRGLAELPVEPAHTAPERSGRSCPPPIRSRGPTPAPSAAGQ